MAVGPEMIPIKDLWRVTYGAATAGHHDDFDTGSSLAGFPPQNQTKKKKNASGALPQLFG